MPLHHYQYQSRTLISIPPGPAATAKAASVRVGPSTSQPRRPRCWPEKLPRSYITLSFVLRPCRHARLSVPLGCGSLCSLGCFLAWGRTNGDGCRRDRFRGCRDRGHSLTTRSRSEERRNEHFVATTVLPFAWEIHRSPGPGQTLKTARLFLFSAGASYPIHGERRHSYTDLAPSDRFQFPGVPDTPIIIKS
jgi:hypothetical protein